MDGFTRFKTATTEELPDAVAVMDPFHVVRLAGDALDECRRRIQQATRGHRGRKTPVRFSADPAHRCRLLTDKQKARLDVLFAEDEPVQVEATWGIYQRMINAYRDPNKAQGSTTMRALIDSVRHGVPTVLIELQRLGRTLYHCAAEFLAYSTARHLQRPHRSDQRPTRTPPRLRPQLPQPH
jgi:transposase